MTLSTTAVAEMGAGRAPPATFRLRDCPLPSGVLFHPPVAKRESRIRCGLMDAYLAPATPVVKSNVIDVPTGFPPASRDVTRQWNWPAAYAERVHALGHLAHPGGVVAPGEGDRVARRPDRDRVRGWAVLDLGIVNGTVMTMDGVRYGAGMAGTLTFHRVVPA